jgi:antitoxin ParD1/3/4
VSITLEPEQERFIQEQVARGRFKSASEVLAHALMLLEQKYREDEAWIEDVRRYLRLVRYRLHSVRL